MNPGIRLGPPYFGLKPELVTVVLSPNRIDVVVRRHGTVVAARRIPISVGDDPAAWTREVHKEFDKLRDVVAELGIQRAPTAVVYTSPTQAVDLVSLTIGSASQARKVAILGCMETIPYPFESAVAEAMVIGRDRSESDAQTHVVVAVDRQDVTGAIAQMTEAVGLKFQSATPIAATIIAWLSGQALRNQGTDRGSLYVGDNGSFFVVGGHATLRLGRSIPIGLETLVESMTRPIRSSGTAESISLSTVEARRILYRQGVGKTDAVIQGHAPLKASHLAPLVQPVLQRFVIELRQSLRFGVPENVRESVALAMTGPGCAVPGFAALLGRELSLPVSLDSRYANFDYDSPASAGCEGNLAAADRRCLAELNLQPPQVAQQRSNSRLRRCLWIGIAAALLIVGLDTVWLQVQLGELRQQEQVLVRETDGVETLQQTQARLATAVDAMSALRSTIVQQVGQHVDFRAVLHELSRLTPQSIQLSSMSFRQSGNQVLGTISGYAEADPLASSQTQLNEFIEALKQSPLINNVELLSVQVASVGETTGERFESGFQVIALPSILALESASPAVEDPQ